MKPTLGSNKTQSYIEYDTNEGKCRFGMEGKRLFYERYDFGQIVEKHYLTTANNKISIPSSELESYNMDYIDPAKVLPVTERFILDADDIVAMNAVPHELVTCEANEIVVLKNALFMYKKVTDDFTVGGDVTLEIGAGLPLTSGIPAADLMVGAADNDVMATILTTAGGLGLVPGNSIYVTNDTAAFVKGLAVGYLVIDITYTKHTLHVP